MGLEISVIIASILLFAGLVGTVLPFIPGVPVAWIGLFVYSYQTGFEYIPLWVMLVFLGLAVIAELLDFIAPLWGARKYKASKYGILGAGLGLVVGILGLGPIGIIVGPIGGAFLGEIISGKKSSQAFSSAFGAVVGFLAGVLIKIVIILIMVGVFISSLI